MGKNSTRLAVLSACLAALGVVLWARRNAREIRELQAMRRRARAIRRSRSPVSVMMIDRRAISPDGPDVLVTRHGTIAEAFEAIEREIDRRAAEAQGDATT